MTKSVAKILSPLILSFIILLCAYLALKQTLGSAFSVLSLFLSDGEEVVVPSEPVGFKPYEGTGEQAEFIDLDDFRFPKRGDLFARLSIDSCGIEDDVYFGGTDAAANRSLVQYYGSHIPGFGKPILIGGHNNRSFRLLGEIAEGDVITITTGYGIYQYRVTYTRILKASDPGSISLSQNKEQLILYTCYPFTTLTLTPDRFFVYADKISGPVILY
ncbi:MAG: class D sortase [Clostridia bacterium]|nr:class D sortase [Clostridia bacterium]